MVASPGALTPIVPEWLANLAALGWRVFVIVALIVALWLLASALWTVTASIAVAVVIAATFAPIVVRLRARGRSRTAAAAIVWVVALVVLLLVGVVLGLALLPYVADVLREVDAGVDEAAGRPGRAATSRPRSSPASAMSSRRCAAAAGDFVATIAASVGERGHDHGPGHVPGLLLPPGRRQGLALDLPGRERPEARAHHRRPATTPWRASAATCGARRSCPRSSPSPTYVFMLLLGVPLALPLAVLVFLSGYIPYFGGIVDDGAHPARHLRGARAGPGRRDARADRHPQRHPGLRRPARGLRPHGEHPSGARPGRAPGRVRAGRHRRPVRGRSRDGGHPRRRQRDGRDRRPRTPPRRCPALVPAWLDRVAQWSWRLLVASPSSRCSSASSWPCRWW